MLPAWPKDELIEEALVAPRHAFAPYPDVQVIERPGWLQLVTPSFKGGGLNGVAFSQLTDDEADRVISDTLRSYRAQGIRFRWEVPPGSTPADLGARLAARGLSREPVRVMARSSAPLELPPAPGVTVELATAANVDDFSRTLAEGWDLSPYDSLAAYNRFLLTQPNQPMFIARVDGQRAGAAGLVLFERSAYLVGAVVLPQFRRRGAYGALSKVRIDFTRSRGLELVSCHARAATSAPLLARLGFEALVDFDLYRE